VWFAVTRTTSVLLHIWKQNPDQIRTLNRVTYRQH